MGSLAVAIVALVIAAFGYGSYYVPVKKYDVHDGLVYQWFLCCGILIGGLTGSIVRNDWWAEGLNSSAFYVAPEGLASGVIWSVANVLATRSVQYFGIGNYYLWHEATNLGGTFVIGVLGPRLGIPAKTPHNIWLSAVGFLFVFLGMIPVVFMKSEGGETPRQMSTEDIDIAITTPGGGVRGLTELFVQTEEGQGAEGSLAQSQGSSSPSRPRLVLPQVMEGAMRSSSRSDVNALTWDGTVGRPDPAQLQRLRFFSDELLTLDTLGCSGGLPVLAERLDIDSADQPLAGQTEGSRRKSANWLKGWILASVTGCILSMQYEPMLNWKQRINQQVTGEEYVFATSLGIFLSSTVWMIVAGGFRRMTGQPMQKPVLRPALLAGLLWSMASYCQLYAMVQLPYAVAYCIVVAGGLAVSLLWGTLRFGEAQTSHNRKCLLVSFGGIFLGILLLGFATV